ncbi:MAG: GIY-YIG nuclease family protein [Candidatus Poseidoniales archaeon]
MADKLLDPGEVYLIGQYEIGTSTPTDYYKIGIVQNDRDSVTRLPEHQTGNPNRLFIAEKIQCEASYMVEQAMHKKWDGVRIGKEWFNLSNQNDLEQVVNDIHDLERSYGPKIVQLRQMYYMTPKQGNNTTLNQDQMKDAEKVRDDAFQVLEKMAKLKYEYETIGFQIRSLNGSQPSMDSISFFKINPAKSEFSDSKLPKDIRDKYKTKENKNKDDFRFVYTATSSNIDNIKLDDKYWRERYSQEYENWLDAKTNWNTFFSSLNPTNITKDMRQRDVAISTMHESYAQKLTEYNELKEEKNVLSIEMRILCGEYQGIEGCCQWKRAPSPKSFNKPEFKIMESAMYNDPQYQNQTDEKLAIHVFEFKAY